MGSFLLLGRPFSCAFGPNLNLERLPLLKVQVSRAPKAIVRVEPIGLGIVRYAELIELGEAQTSVLASCFCKTGVDEPPGRVAVRVCFWRHDVTLHRLPARRHIA